MPIQAARIVSGSSLMAEDTERQIAGSGADPSHRADDVQG
jgi:hypothetical protein